MRPCFRVVNHRVALRVNGGYTRQSFSELPERHILRSMPKKVCRTTRAAPPGVGVNPSRHLLRRQEPSTHSPPSKRRRNDDGSGTGAASRNVVPIRSSSKSNCPGFTPPANSIT